MLPLAQRVLEKLIALVDKEMIKVGGAKMAAPILMPAALWKKSGSRHSLTHSHRPCWSKVLHS